MEEEVEDFGAVGEGQVEEGMSALEGLAEAEAGDGLVADGGDDVDADWFRRGLGEGEREGEEW